MGLGVHNPLDPQCFLYNREPRFPGESGYLNPPNVVEEPEASEPVAKTAWEIVDGVATSAVHAHADASGMAPGLVVTDWVFLAVARGFNGEREISQDVILRSGSPHTLLGMLDVARSSQRAELARAHEGE